LLCLGEMMDLINEQDRLSPGRAQTIHGCSDDPAHLGDIAFHATNPDEFCVRHLRNDAGQRGLAGAGRPGKNHRRQSIGFNGTAQQLARPQDVLLADEFIERVRAHPRCKRRIIGARDFNIFVISEKILHKGNYGAPVTQAIVPAPIPRKADALFGQAAGTYPEALELSKRPPSSIGCDTTYSLAK
jgi:hypothetical protein